MKHLAAFAVFLFATLAHAAGPRWVAGPQWTNAGSAMGWYRNDVQYFVDAGGLSASVDHAAAIAVVDAAAAVWNLNGLSLTLKNGGSLAEDVSADNVYLGTGGLVWPSDVTSANYTAKQIAVVFDADGSVTDSLLGAGASAPGNCRTNGVTENVDLFIQPGRIAHAIVVVNGRCSGPAPEQQLQLQYQLMRVFGRVLGLGWSQTNDNVFTGSPAPTFQQEMYWPILHPIDILCGPYTYQCLPQPFTLRPDDIAAMWIVYADANTSYANNGMVKMSGNVAFPGNVQMAGMNLTVRTFQVWGDAGTDPFETVSAVSGTGFSTDRGNPVTGPGGDTLGIYGSPAASGSAAYNLAVPLAGSASLQVSSEAINPLYVGAYAVGPYRTGSPTPSGSAMMVQNGTFVAGRMFFLPYTVPDAVSNCGTGADGAENAPASLPSDGIWTGRLCSVGHTSWFGFAVKAGRTATVEVTATDESGGATGSKAMPLVGLWHASDATGTLPGIARAATAFNTSRIGMTNMRASFAAAESVRLAVTDARGDGRPDYTYRARVLYADTVSPSRLTAAGGTIVLGGTGFAAGNTVTVGGVAAKVVSISATQIRAIAPAASALRSSGAQDVVVTDVGTGGAASITGGVVYGGAPTDVLSVTSQPTGSVPVGASELVGLRLVDAGGAPVRNGSIVLSAASGTAVFSACNLAQCTVLTDASGAVQTIVSASATGTVRLRAVSAGGSSVAISFTAVETTQAITLLRSTEYIASGSGAVFTPTVSLVSDGSAATGQAVIWSASTKRTGLSAASSTANAAGISSDPASGSLRDGEAATVQVCAWTNVCATGNIIGVAPADLRAAAISGDAQNLTASDSLGPLVLRVVDTAGHPVAGALVALYQAVSGWQPPCATGRCATAPVYGTTSSTTVSDDDGSITVTPLQYPNTAAVTKITASVGTEGSLTVTLAKVP